MKNDRNNAAARLEEKLYPHKDMTERIIGCAIDVHRELRSGYIENIYENALAEELTQRKVAFERQVILPVFYRGVPVGEHRADMIIENKVVVELKAVSQLASQHKAQLMSTLRAASLRVGLLLNFAETRLVDGIQRVIL